MLAFQLWFLFDTGAVRDLQTDVIETLFLGKTSRPPVVRPSTLLELVIATFVCVRITIRYNLFVAIGAVAL